MIASGAMPGDRPPRPKAAPVRTSFVDGGWEEGTDTEVEQPAPDVIAQDESVRPPTGPLPPPPVPPDFVPAPPEPARVEEGSVTEVDTLLEAIDDDVDATLATVRREQIEHMLGAPPPDASPYAAAVPQAPLPELGLPPAAGPPQPVAPVPSLPDAPPTPAAGRVDVAPPQGHVDLRYAGEPAPPSSGRAPGGAPSRTVRVAGAEIPLWLPVVAVVVAASIGSLLLGFALGRGRRAVDEAARAPSPALPSAGPAASATPAATSLVERASAGEPAAIKQLEARSELDVDAALALSRGRMMQRRNELEKIGRELQQKPALASDQGVSRGLISAARDPETAREALRIMATLPGAAGPDLLYETWTGTPRRTATTRLAEKLVYEKSVRARATPALAVALDLRKAQSCEENQKLLSAAKDYGDRRSLHLLALLQRRFGCGPHKRQDCYGCLRDSDDLPDAIKAVRGRAAPKF